MAAAVDDEVKAVKTDSVAGWKEDEEVVWKEVAVVVKVAVELAVAERDSSACPEGSPLQLPLARTFLRSFSHSQTTSACFDNHPGGD